MFLARVMALISVFLVHTQLYAGSKDIVHQGGGLMFRANHHIYDIDLFVKKGHELEDFDMEQPFRLRLDYQVDYDLDETIEYLMLDFKRMGLTHQETLSSWSEQLRDILTDVKKGDVISYIFVPNDTTFFYKNHKFLGKISDSDFSRWFFGIWLHPQAAHVKLRKDLLGNK